MNKHFDHFEEASAQARSALALTPNEKETLEFLLPLSSNYPCFEQWFLARVIPGLRNETRHLVCIERGGKLVGVGIGKNDGIERKICTVRIERSYFGRGLGLKIFDTLLSWLNTDQPHLTVTKKTLPAFERIFDYYGFKATSAQLGRYLPQDIEIAYNEPKTSAIGPSKLNGLFASATTKRIPRSTA